MNTKMFNCGFEIATQMQLLGRLLIKTILKARSVLESIGCFYVTIAIKVSITFICNQYVNINRLQSSHHPVFSYTMIFKSSGPTPTVT